MSWTSKVAWKEGLFLHPHDRHEVGQHKEWLVPPRTADITHYFWAVNELGFSRDLPLQAKMGMISVAGSFPDSKSFKEPAIGMHFAGKRSDLKQETWAIPESV